MLAVFIVNDIRNCAAFSSVKLSYMALAETAVC